MTFLRLVDCAAQGGRGGKPALIYCVEYRGAVSSMQALFGDLLARFAAGHAFTTMTIPAGHVRRTYMDVFTAVGSAAVFSLLLRNSEKMVVAESAIMPARNQMPPI